MEILDNILRPAVALLSIAVFALLTLSFARPDGADWPVYGHDAGGQHYSPLSAINRKNVAALHTAWTFRTGDAYTPPHGRPTAFESTPLYINGTLYLTTPLGRLIALDPLTGKQRWAYDGKVPRTKAMAISRIAAPPPGLRLPAVCASSSPPSMPA